MLIVNVDVDKGKHMLQLEGDLEKVVMESAKALQIIHHAIIENIPSAGKTFRKTLIAVLEDDELWTDDDVNEVARIDCKKIEAES